jgi:hypothetical protein
MTRDEGIHLPVGERLPSQESLLKYDECRGYGPRANCWRRYGRERIASFVRDRSTGHAGAPCSGSATERLTWPARVRRDLAA